MVSNIPLYKAKNMYFPSREAYSLIKEFDKQLSPLFSNGKGWDEEIFKDFFENFLRFDGKLVSDKIYDVTEDHYVKILMELTDILEKLEKFSYIKIRRKPKYLFEEVFEKTFPNIINMYDFERRIRRSCPLDVDGTLDMQGIDYTDATLCELSKRLNKMGVY